MEDKILRALPGVQKNILLKDYTSYKIGGPAKYFFVAKTKEDLLVAVKTAKNFALPIFILGGGSNLLISEKGFKGLVIKADISDIEFQGNKAFVGAGVNLTKLAYLAADNGLSGLEWAAGIPGTIGGAVYGHAQAFGMKISDIVKSVETINLETLEVHNFTKEQCQFSLKDSIFKQSKNWLIVSAVLEFKNKDAQQVKNQIKEFLEYRRDKHPMEFPSVGSTFINPEKIDEKLISKYPEIEGFIKNGAIPAGYLIAKSGLAGKKIGNAQISEKHANFIINLGGAKADDVLALINLAKKKVKKTFGVDLEPEVQFVT